MSHAGNDDGVLGRGADGRDAASPVRSVSQNACAETRSCVRSMSAKRLALIVLDDENEECVSRTVPSANTFRKKL